MIKQPRLGDIIHERIQLRQLPTGWETCHCQLCADYKDRASFLFAGDEIIYSCFNCGVKSKYEEYSGRISRNFRRVLGSFGIDDSDISAAVNSAFFRKQKEGPISLESLKKKTSLAAPTIALPPRTYPLGHSEFQELQVPLVSYLTGRAVNLERYSFFFSLETNLLNRVIIPFYREGRLIYWQARSIKPDERRRYLNTTASRSAVLFNFDQLRRYSHGPLFVTEGVFDAMMLDGVAIVGSRLSEAQSKLLESSPRRLVFVIDKDVNGQHLAEDVCSRGWEITFTQPGTVDLNHSVQRFGLSYTIYGLMQNIRAAGDAARLSIELNCKGTA